MSNPYDPYNQGNQGNQGDQGDQGQGGQGEPAGQPPGQPGGQPDPYGSPPSPYGTPPSYGAPMPGGPPYGAPGYGTQQPAKTDALSIVGFVLSLTCCLSVVGAILGFIGLGRTKQGQRKGRWAAISATIIGTLGTLAFAAIIVGIVFVSKHVVTVNNANAGECVNINKSSSSSSSDFDTYSLTKKGCSDSHDAEVIYVGEAGSDAGQLQDGTAQQAVQVCQQRSGSSYSGVFSDSYKIDVVFDDPDHIDSSDKFLCLAESASGDKLTHSLG